MTLSAKDGPNVRRLFAKPPVPVDEQYLTPEDVASQHKVSKAKIYQECKRYLANNQVGLPCVRIGRLIRIPESGIGVWISRQMGGEGCN